MFGWGLGVWRFRVWNFGVDWGILGVQGSGLKLSGVVRFLYLVAGNEDL